MTDDSQSMAASQKDGARRLLLVDDDPAVLRAYERAFQGAGYHPIVASDGIEAKKLIEGMSFDVILSDVEMPGMDGLELLRAVRARDLDVPVILVTGADSEEAATRAVENGALYYLVKPVPTPTLLQVTQHAARLHAVARLKRAAIERSGGGERQIGDRAGLEAIFARAIESLWMAFQPIVRPRERVVYAYEALMRSSEPLLPNPGAVLYAAEKLGRLSDLGRTVRALVAAAADELSGDTRLFVNLHPADLLDEQLYSRAAPLSKVAERVVLEITERASLDDIGDVAGRIAKLRGLGYRIAIDDLGAGYAGLTAFAQLKPELVKLDMTLVRNLHEEVVLRKIVGSMSALCREMAIEVVAEGVEVSLERDALHDLGCPLMQGYYFARPARGFPMPAAW